MQLADRVALVTGGGAGIGRATANLLAQEGCKVAILDHDAEKAERTYGELVRAGRNVMLVTADIADPAQMENAIRHIIDRWERLDIVFANAGINGVWAPLDELSPEEWDRTLGTNLKGTFLTVKSALSALKLRGGSIIITSSINGTRIFSNTGATAYSCSKAAEVAFAKMMAVELARHKVRINVICPGAIATEIGESTETRDLEKVQEPVIYPEGEIPLTRGKPGTPEQVAQLVLFLASDAADLITGTEIYIDGAESLLG